MRSQLTKDHLAMFTFLSCVFPAGGSFFHWWSSLKRCVTHVEWLLETKMLFFHSNLLNLSSSTSSSSFIQRLSFWKRRSIETVADTDIEERSSFTRFPKYSQVFPNIRKYSQIFASRYISISHFFIHRKILHGWSSLWDNRTRKRLQRRPERETRQSFVLTLNNHFVGRTFAQDDHPPPCSWLLFSSQAEK